MMTISTRIAIMLLAACTSSTELSSLRNVSISIDTKVVDGSPDQMVVTLSSSGCPTLAVDATLNGQPFDHADQGHTQSEGIEGTQCVHPTFVMDSVDPGPATIEVADASATVTVSITDLLTARALDLAPDSTTFRANDTLHFTSSLAQDAASLPTVYATTPGALVAAQNGDYCGLPLFDGALQPETGDYTFASPDVFAQWQGTPCDYVLVRGTAVPVDLDLGLYVPLGCDGLTCDASWSPSHIVHATYVP
jgi:hypothetical protein